MNTQTRWPGFKYEQVHTLANRYIARYLRTQRKNMRAFFAQRGLTGLALQMDNIRNANTTMMEKNRRFQRVLNDYAELARAGSSTQPATEAAHQQDAAGAVLDVPGAGPVLVGAADAGGPGEDAGAGVQGLAASDDGVVVDE